MARALVAAVFFAAVISAATSLRGSSRGAAQWANEPKFCNGINCPNFTTVASCSGFDIREYPAAYWVGADFYGPGTSDFQTAEHQGFEDNFQYITGANVAGEKIDMTAPVLNKIVPGAGPNCNTTFTVSFFIPFIHQGNAPAPTNSNVKVRKHPKLQVAVRSFGGWVTSWESSVAPNFLSLGTDLGNANITFAQSEEWVAQYNSPFTIFNRHNEVWYPTSLTEAELLKC